MNLLDLGSFNLSISASIVSVGGARHIHIDDTGEDDQSGGRILFPIAVANNQTVGTAMTIIGTTHPLRWNIAGQHGTAHTEPGLHVENVTASADGFASIEYPPCAVADIAFDSLSVG